MFVNKKIGIVTVLYRSESVLEEFIYTLNMQSYKNFILYAVDNNSPDNSLVCLDRLKKKVDFEIIILPQQVNGGVARGNNIGISKAISDGCDLILLSNNDVKLASDALLNLYQGLQEMNALLAIPKVYFYNSTKLNSVGGNFVYYSGLFKHRGYAIEDANKFNQRTWVECAPTCFMLMDKKIFETVGFMDELYFVYFDDTDFIYRAWKLGYKIAYIPESVIDHKESVCTGGSRSDFSLSYYHRNLMYFARKNFSYFHYCIVLLYTYLKLYLRDIWRLDNHQQYKLILKSLHEGRKLYNQNRND